ncbi:FtsK/SpoIIIE domain-containing protein [Agromyces sp. ZXT2-3]|uniref:FtsK/SpoIIIE domain-containing protein n=1 Tax=Agromyces sp. ZXT2-3 TaxID=3461152 RepID=UPI004054BCC2
MTDAAATTLERLPGLRLPPAPPEPPRAAFPWIASAAPVAGAIAIWALTGSVLSLAFAALGPLVAVAAVLDARRTARRARREARRDRDEHLARLASEVDRRHALERAAAWRATPSAAALAVTAAPAWLPGLPELVVIGTGAVPSGVTIEGDAGDDPDAEAVVAAASRLDGAPVRVAIGGGIGFVGAPALARAVARTAILQCAAAAHPASARIDGPGGAAWEWLGALPHGATGPGAGVLRLVDAIRSPGDTGDEAASMGDDGSMPPAVVFAIATDHGALPPGIRTIVEVSAPRAALVRRHGDEAAAVRPELVSEAEAGASAARLARLARRIGLGAGAAGIPEAVALSDLLAAESGPADRSTLAVAVGGGRGGPVEIDLVAGPHALVAGTSGSGKSELLVAWITALAARYPPDRVAFLLVDFKGGAAFEPVRRLPHVAGLVTDLDEEEAERAVASIRAELRHRERVLAAAGARRIADLADSVVLPRLVVVVDEFQAMIERFAGLGAVVADVAARGRSLGVHLVLAAQRPNGVVREQVSANCGIRVSLRVLDRSDSIAVVGSDRAAALDARRPGRAVVDRGDGRVVEFQSALAGRETIDALTTRHAATAPPRRPWLDPLPERIGLDGLEAVLAVSSSPGAEADSVSADDGGASPARSRAGELRPERTIVLGVVDEPDHQRRTAARWNPEVDGALLVLGASGSGRTALLEAVAAQVARRDGPNAVLRLDGPRSRVWDALTAIRAGAGSSVRLFAVDDVDTRFAGWPDDHRLAAIAALEDILRLGRDGGPAVALSAARSSAISSAVRDAATTLVLLRHPSRADLVHAGGDGALHRVDGPPGSGQWRGRRAQFLHAERAASVAARREAPPWRMGARGVVAICSATAAVDADAIARHAPHAEVIRLADGPDAWRLAQSALDHGADAAATAVVGDADAWAANWSLAASARSRAELVVHGGAAEHRALARGTGLPPLLDEDRDQCWVIPVGGDAERASWSGPERRIPSVPDPDGH